MRSLLFVALLVYGLDTITGVSVFIKNSTVIVDDKPVDLKKLEVIEELPFATRYLLHAGDTNITITKSKVSNALSVSTESKMTPEQAAKLKKLHEKMTHKIQEKVQHIQSEVDAQIKAISEKINSNFKNMFQGFPSLPFF